MVSTCNMITSYIKTLDGNCSDIESVFSIHLTVSTFFEYMT